MTTSPTARSLSIAAQLAVLLATLLLLAYALGERSGYRHGREDAWRNYMDLQSMVTDRVDKSIAAGVIP